MPDVAARSRDLEGLRLLLNEVALQVRPGGSDLIIGAIAAMQRDRDLADIIRAGWLEPRLAACRETVRATLPSTLSEDIANLIADIGPALLVFRALMTGEPIDVTAVTASSKN